MRVTLVLLASFFCISTAVADQFQDAYTTIPSRSAQSGIILNPEFPPQAEKNLAAPTRAEDSTIIPWGSQKQYRINGAAIFTYKQNRYSVKAGFIRGVYDTFAKNYVTTPIILLADVTDIDNPRNIATSDILELTKPYNFVFTDTSGNKLTVIFTPASKKLEISPEGTNNIIFSTDFSQLTKLWATDAERYKRQIFGKTYYFMPQVWHAYDGEAFAGFVASEGTPLYYTTKRPLDFISVLHGNQQAQAYKPIAYSIPLGLKLKFLGTDPTSDEDTWQIEKMIKEDLNDALNDAAVDTYIFPR